MESIELYPGKPGDLCWGPYDYYVTRTQKTTLNGLKNLMTGLPDYRMLMSATDLFLRDISARNAHGWRHSRATSSFSNGPSKRSDHKQPVGDDVNGSYISRKGERAHRDAREVATGSRVRDSHQPITGRTNPHCRVDAEHQHHSTELKRGDAIIKFVEWKPGQRVEARHATYHRNWGMATVKSQHEAYVEVVFDYWLRRPATNDRMRDGSIPTYYMNVREPGAPDPISLL